MLHALNVWVEYQSDSQTVAQDLRTKRFKCAFNMNWIHVCMKIRCDVVYYGTVCAREIEVILQIYYNNESVDICVRRAEEGRC